MSLMSEATAEAARIAQDVKAAQTGGKNLMSEATAAAAKLGAETRQNYKWDDPEQTLQEIRADGDDQPIDLSQDSYYSDKQVLERLSDFEKKARG